MIVVKENGVVYFASPMAFHNFSMNTKADYASEENSYIWHLNDGHGTIVLSHAKFGRLTDLLRYSDAFNCEFTKEGMTQVVENIKKLVEGTNCSIVDDGLGATLCVARGDKVYNIASNGAVCEIDDFECIGEGGGGRMHAAYDQCRDISDVHKRIAAAYSLVEGSSSFRHLPVAVINTKDESYTLLTEKL